ncbi:protein phosphatase CheZ [Sphaerotilus montanus]|uniref:Protein phosphatase CheZ n=1 Tax=Sphaerotilus montanus TaxID=522889 RepID=A0A7Y9R0S8_9BURK|nr:protein phosphatase CheZ [Sphaerotilus montanus]NYG33368.1 chemotaxis protein CheZ [Sphaerotilus montanus]NZD56998.1 protein phosphatase CheZ [Sphaerotilus montanus]
MTDQQNHYASPEVIRQIGEITRKLHDSVAQMGLMGDLQAATQALPDARSRLNYIARKTSEAAEKVLNSVDAAKLEQQCISDAAREIQTRLSAQADPATEAQMHAGIAQVQGCAQRIDDHLTNIMVAQDFHDLTGQIVSKVVRLTADLEQNLVQLLLQIAPEYKPSAAMVNEDDLHGPVVNPEARTDVVSDQNEVDDLLARMGF